MLRIIKTQFLRDIKKVKLLRETFVQTIDNHHEINNPINGIVNYGQLIVDSEGKEDDIVNFATKINN